MSEGFVLAREGCDLAGERWPGGAQLVVLLHEGVSDRRGWRQVAGRLAPRATVVAYDRRGYGESPVSTAPFTHVDDVLAVLDREQAGRAARRARRDLSAATVPAMNTGAGRRPMTIAPNERPDMSHEPQIQARAAQHYAAIPATVAMDGISAAVDDAFPELFGWLAGQGIAPAGPPLIRYLVIDMAGELQIELGVPVAAPVAASGRVQPGVLPEGRYAVLRHTGPYDGLVASNAALLRWAQENGIELDTWDTPQGSAWRGRAEHYLTDPSQEPDPAKLETDVAFLTRQA